MNQPPAGQSTHAANGNAEQHVKTRVHRRLLETLDLTEARQMPIDRLHQECTRRVEQLLNEARCPLAAPEKQRLVGEVIDEIFGLGPIEELMRQQGVTDVLVNGPHHIYIERDGVLEHTHKRFRDNDHLVQVIQRIAARVGRRIDESSPMLDARLQDGSRVNAIIPPLSLDGPMMSIRRFDPVPFDVARLVQCEALAPEMAEFLEHCVTARANLLIAGGTGSGKTTLLNALSRGINDTERVITIEDAAELQLQREHVVRLETRPPNVEGEGEVTPRDLLRNALRMRPDRIIIGEVRGIEALDMLQAMNTGHEGSMTTVHANTPRDALRRIENMVSMTGLNYPVHVIRQQIASAIDVVVHVSRLTGGKRKVVQIAEITGVEGDAICLQDVFRYRQTGLDPTGAASGTFEATGVRPTMLNRMREEGIEMPAIAFHPRTLQMHGPGHQGVEHDV
jgi:pilus assembly protein CpaF